MSARSPVMFVVERSWQGATPTGRRQCIAQYIPPAHMYAQVPHWSVEPAACILHHSWNMGSKQLPEKQDYQIRLKMTCLRSVMRRRLGTCRHLVLISLLSQYHISVSIASLKERKILGCQHCFSTRTHKKMQSVHFFRYNQATCRDSFSNESNLSGQTYWAVIIAAKV